MTTQDANFNGANETPPPVGDENSNGISQEVAEIIVNNAGWIKFLAYISILYGILICLSLVGIVIGWLPIWVGSILLKICSNAKDAIATGSTFDLHKSFDSIGLYFKITGILGMICLVIVSIALIIGFASLSLL